MKLDCSQIQDELLAYHHNELPLRARVLVRWHLSHCPDCRKEMTIMEQISTTLTEAEPRDEKILNSLLRGKILSSLPEAPVAPRARPAIRRFTLVDALAIAAVLGVLAAILFPVFSRSRENARRASVQSNMKEIPLGISNTFNAAGNQMTDDDDAQTPALSSPASSPDSLEPRVADAVRRDYQRRAKPQQRISGNVGDAADSVSSGSTTVNGGLHLDGSNYAFNDGHAKWRQRERKSKEQIFEDGWNRLAGKAGSTPLTPYRRVHKEGSLSVDVENLEQDSDAVEAMVKKAGGFVANNTLSTEKDGHKSAALEIRVPVSQFESIIEQIASLGEVKSKRVQGEDITAQVSDANEENNVLANDLRTRLAQYQKAKERAARKNKSVPDDWQQRAEIRQMRIQLAQVRARIEYLKKLSDFAALSVQLREDSQVFSGGGFLNDVGNTGRAAWQSFIIAARLPMTLLIYLLVYSPFWVPILIAWRYFMRRPAQI